MSTPVIVPPVHAAPIPAPVAEPVILKPVPRNPEEQAAWLRAEVKDLLLYELRSKGYAPNPADVGTAVDRLLEIIEREVKGEPPLASAK